MYRTVSSASSKLFSWNIFERTRNKWFDKKEMSKSFHDNGGKGLRYFALAQASLLLLKRGVGIAFKFCCVGFI
jgi:hypothetical protein